MVKIAKMVTLSVLCLLLLSAVTGCALPGSDSQEQAESAAFELLEAIRTDDADRLPEVMSQAALNAPDLAQGFHYASSLLDGPVIAFGEPSTMEEYAVEKGKSFLRYEIYFKLRTSEQEYYLVVDYYYKNDFDKSKAGIYRAYFDEKQRHDEEVEHMRELRAQADVENRALPEWYYGAAYERPGIYHPGWKE